MTRRELLQRWTAAAGLGALFLAGCKKAGKEPEEDTNMAGGEPSAPPVGERGAAVPPPPGPGGQPPPAQSSEFSGDVH